MSDADKAYEAAKAEIERVRAAGDGILNLESETYNALTTLPPEIATLSAVNFIDLNKTQITDISPLHDLTGLTTLYLNNTQVADIAPLAGLENLTNLYLSNTQVADIAPLAELTNLTKLYLSDTQVADVAPMAGLTNLTELRLNNTGIADIAPLTGLKNLTVLHLDETQVADIAPLAELINLTSLQLSDSRLADIAALKNLSNLEVLSIDGTSVSDLRSLIPLEGLGKGEAFGLLYENTPASRSSPELMRLSQVKDHNYAKCYRDTRDYLLTLPPWPEPLPWDVPEPDIPHNRTAPLQVVDIDGVLHRAAPSDGLPPDASDLAQQGWQALREFLEDLEGQRARIGNAMPQLGRALTRLDTALAGQYAQMNPVAVGTHGNRIIRQAGLSGDILLDGDAADIQEFAAALALFLERFTEWRTYRDAAHAHPPRPEDVLEAAREIEAMAQDLTSADQIAQEIPEDLQDQIADVRDAPDDPIPATGLIASFSNVAAGIMARLVPIWKTCATELKDIGTQSWTVAKKSIAVALGGSAVPLVMLGLDLLVTKGATFASLATKFPTQLGWLQKLMQAFGLL